MRYAATILLLFMATAASAETTIEWWQFWTDPAIKPTINELTREFEQAHPDIKVNITDLTWSNGHEKIVLAFSSGKAPDVVELGSDWIAQFAFNDQLADISGMIVEDSAEFDGWGMATYQDQVYGFPWLLGTRVLFGNRDLLTKAGYDEDFVPLKWLDLRDAAKKVHKLGDDVYGWGSNTAEKHRLYKKFLPFFWSQNAQIFSDDGKYCVISSQYAVDALSLYKILNDSAGFVGTQREIEDAFLDGKIGFVLSGDWLLKRIELENRDIDFFTTLMPGQRFPGQSFLGGEFLAISQDSEHKEAAMKFIRHITSPENQVRFCKANYTATPSSLEAQEDPFFTSNVHFQTFIKQARLSKHPPVDPDWVHIEHIIEEAVEDALFGSELVAEPLRTARAKIQKLIDQE